MTKRRIGDEDEDKDSQSKDNKLTPKKKVMIKQEIDDKIEKSVIIINQKTVMIK